MKYLYTKKCACGHDRKLHDTHGCAVWMKAGTDLMRCGCLELELSRPASGKAQVSTWESDPEMVIVRVVGDLDFTTSHRLESAIHGAERVDKGVVIVDLTRCNYVDSSVLTVLVRCYKAMGKLLRIVVPTDAQIRRIFTITNLDVF